jgi:hypothetical protein
MQHQKYLKISQLYAQHKSNSSPPLTFSSFIHRAQDEIGGFGSDIVWLVVGFWLLVFGFWF